MSIMIPKIELVDRTTRSIRYLEHGWPTPLCRWHAHEEYELHLVTATRGKAFVGDHIGEFEAGDLFLTGPNLPHNWVTDTVWTDPVDIRDMLVQFSHDSVAKLVEGFAEFNDVGEMLAQAQSGIQFVGFEPAQARHHMESIRGAQGAERILAFVRFLTVLSGHADKKTLSTAKIIRLEGRSKQARICNVVDHIITHFREELSLAQAAKIAAMTEATFVRNFPTVTGHNFVDFVTTIRIGQACGMLYATDDAIADIGHKAGFRNLANFNRHFRKLKGVTPTQYRNIARKELVKQNDDQHEH